MASSTSSLEVETNNDNNDNINNIEEGHPLMKDDNQENEDLDRQRRLLQRNNNAMFQSIILNWLFLVGGLTFLIALIASWISFIVEAFYAVYYPLGVSCLLLLQHKLDNANIQRFLIVRWLDLDFICIPWLLFLWICMNIDLYNSNSSSNQFLDDLLSLLFILFVFVCALSVVWITSRKTYLTYKQYNIVRDEQRRNAILCRAVVVVGLCVFLYLDANNNVRGYYQNKANNPLSPAVVSILDMFLALAIPVGLAVVFPEQRKCFLNKFCACGNKNNNDNNVIIEQQNESSNTSENFAANTNNNTTETSEATEEISEEAGGHENPSSIIKPATE